MGALTVRDGTTLHVRDEGTGPTLLILPGWGVSTWWFERQFASLTDAFRVVAYDPRGQGESEKTLRGQRTARLAADLAEVIEWTGEDRVHLLPWSGGGSTALAYVELFGTARLRTLTLVSAGPKLMKTDDWDLGFVDLEGLQAWVGLIRGDFRAAAESLMPAFFAAEPEGEEREAILTEMAKCEPEAMARASWDFILQDYRDVLDRIDVPTLVVTGAADAAVPAGNAPYLHEHIAGSRLEVIDAAAHCSFMEQPDTFNALVREFCGAR